MEKKTLAVWNINPFISMVGIQRERVLVSLFFICKDGDSYSMPMVYFSEEQAKEIQLTIDKIKK